MPDILLIQPPIRDFYRTAKRTIPYGLACIAASLEAGGFSVTLLDSLATRKSRPLDLPPEMGHLTPFYGRPDHSPFALFHQYRHFGYSFEHIGNIAAESNAFLAGIASLFTAYSEEALETARIVKERLPGAAIVLGGHHPTALPEAVMDCDAVDYVIRGEGEESLPLLAKVLRSGGDPAQVPGIVFRKPGGGLHISSPAMVARLDSNPLPAVHLVRNRFYRRHGRGSAVITASRGCPLRCSYCAVGGSGLPYRRRSVTSVLREMEQAVTEQDARFIDFEDENLSLDRDWFLDLLAGIQDRFGGLGLELRAMNGLFAPTLDATVVRAMRAVGFTALNLSLGSTHPEQLRRFGRPDVRPALENAVAQGREAGLDVVCYIIVGAPDQQADASVDDLVYLMRRNVLAGVSVFYPAPGSADYDRCAALGCLPDRFALMRASALPVSHTTDRREAVTLMRLGRIANFMKALADSGKEIPRPAPLEVDRLPPDLDREEAGTVLLAAFLQDGIIRGVMPDGMVYRHDISERLTRRFLEKLAGEKP